VYGFGKYVWPAGDLCPSGLEIHVYGDGRVKVGAWDTVVEVFDVMNRRPGRSRGGGHVIVRFRPASDCPPP